MRDLSRNFKAGIREYLSISSILLVREASKLKNVTKSGISPKGGGGVSTKHQKVQNSKVGLFDKRGGRLYFLFFPNVNVDFKCFS